MKSFAVAYPDSQFGGDSILQATPAKLTWYHHTTDLQQNTGRGPRDKNSSNMLTLPFIKFQQSAGTVILPSGFHPRTPERYIKLNNA